MQPSAQGFCDKSRNRHTRTRVCVANRIHRPYVYTTEKSLLKVAAAAADRYGNSVRKPKRPRRRSTASSRASGFLLSLAVTHYHVNFSSNGTNYPDLFPTQQVHRIAFELLVGVGGNGSGVGGGGEQCLPVFTHMHARARAHTHVKLMRNSQLMI